MPTPKQHSTDAARQKAYRARVKQLHSQERNEKGLPPGSPIGSMPSLRRWQGLIELSHSSLCCVLDEMQSYYDDRSESWQENDRGEAFKERLELIETIVDEMSSLRLDN